MKASAILIALLGASRAFAAVTVDLDAGQLTGPPTAPMVADNSIGSNLGSLLLLIDLPTSSVSDTLTAGNYVSGGDSILAAGGFNDNGGTNETLTSFIIPNSVLSNVNTGDDIALRWFPQISLSSYESGEVPATGDDFGTYNPSGRNPDGGDLWTIPSSGDLISLNFFTMNSGGGGTQPNIEGLADSLVLAVPEPSSWALVASGALTSILIACLRKKIQCRLSGSVGPDKISYSPKKRTDPVANSERSRWQHRSGWLRWTKRWDSSL